MNRSGRFHITLPEILIGLVVLLFLAGLALPRIGSGLTRGRAAQMLSNMRQLHLATQQMALDGTTTGDVTLCWPGTNGIVFWETNLVPSYLSTNDFRKLMGPPMADPGEERAWSLRRLRAWWSGLSAPPAFPMANTNAVLVYAVADSSATNTVFLSSANFTNTPAGGILNPDGEPLDAKSFIVVRKDGSGAILSLKNAGHTNTLGAFAPLLP